MWGDLNLNALILCAGRGTRLQSVIGNQPKATIKFGEFNLLQRLLKELLLVESISKIYINISIGAKELVRDSQLVQYFPKITILYESIPWGPSLTVYEAMKYSNQGLLVIHGDLLLETGALGNFASGLQRYGDEKYIVAVHERSILDASQVIRVDKLGFVKEIIWRKDSAALFEQYRHEGRGSTFVDSGIYYFSSTLRNFLKKPECESGISEGLLPELLDKDMLKAVPWRGLRFAIDNGDKLEQARNAFKLYPEKFHI